MKIFKFFKYSITFLIFFAFLFVIKDEIKKSKKGTYLKVFSKSQFRKKLKKAPKWMDDQIADDIGDIQTLSQEALDLTYRKIKRHSCEFKKDFIRYRIINNKLYRYYNSLDEFDTKKLDFEKAIKTLSKTKKLPNIDFIYCRLDGLPQLDGHFTKDLKEDFYSLLDTNVQAPIFCQAKIKGYKNLILIPDHNSLSDNWFKLYNKILKANTTLSWQDKKEKAFWRGGTNDKEYFLDNYQTKPRFILSKLSLDHSHLLDAGMTTSWFMKMEDILKTENVIKEYANEIKHMNYKYLPVVDGHMCTYPGYQWRLLSNSLSFKQKSNEVQWFYNALVPYKHYIPIENDLSDLIDKITWAKENGDKCSAIVNSATDFAQNNLSFEDIYVYLYKVLKQYSKFQNLENKKLIKTMKKDPRWICIQNKIKKCKKTL